MTQRITDHPLFRPRTQRFTVRKVHLREAMNFISIKGLYLEFGVWEGTTINYIARLFPSKTIYGFDSWQGIPEDWQVQGCLKPKGSWSADGQLPDVRKNVKLISGLFEDSFPVFLETAPDLPVAFAHIDSDLYSSAKSIFNHFGKRFVSGTIIVFDEYMQDAGEKQAFEEWLEESNMYAAMLGHTEEHASFMIHDGNRSFDQDRRRWGVDTGPYCWFVP
jgi:hypothetical protein